jgi:hypothetical protein
MEVVGCVVPVNALEVNIYRLGTQKLGTDFFPQL